MHDPERCEALQKRLAELGVREDVPFRLPELVVESLTHSSYATERGARDNERLEMLGDAVLGFLVAELLFDEYAEAPEGVLTRLRASLVGEQSLAAKARWLELGPLIRLGRGEEQSGGRDRPGLLADAFEALVAALYKSEGLSLADRLVRALFVEEARAHERHAPQPADFKTALQERAQGRWKIKPEYRIVSVSGPDHARTFVAEASVLGIRAGEGAGRSKKQAEQQAAQVALGGWDSLAQKVEEVIASTAPAGPEASAPEAASVEAAADEGEATADPDGTVPSADSPEAAPLERPSE